MTLAEPKTDRARRTLRIPTEVHDALREHRVAQVEERLAAGPRWADLGFVFRHKDGKPLMARNVVRGFHDHLRSAGLPHQRWHDLRHAYATLLLEDGEELAVISRTLGHSNITTTANIYAHLTPAMLEWTAYGRHPYSPQEGDWRVKLGYRQGYTPQRNPRRDERRGSFRAWICGEPGRT
jgi:site-specific recombinase XerD